MLTVGSLFAGIGGFDLGFERAGMHTRWQVELDPFCRAVLARHFPDAERHADVRGVGVHNLEPVDVICGGFPCQDLSYAGAGAGLAGARSGLWSEYARIVGELRPRYVVVENVSALLARGLGTVLGDLAALGYDAEWDCIPASAVGAPHRRDRIWLVAYPGGEQHEGPSDAQRRETTSGLPQAHPNAYGGRLEVGTEPDGEPQQSRFAAPLGDDPDGLRDALADADCEARDGSRSPASAVQEPSSLERPGRRGGVGGAGVVQDADECALQPWRVGGRATQAGGAEWWSVEPPVGRVAHGVPNRLDQLAALGNALVPQIAEWLGRRILDYESSVTA